MADSRAHLLALIFACIFFGYAMINSLVFYRRARRVESYKSKAIGNFVKSPGYGQAVWISGIIGAVGFAIASWKLIMALWHIHVG
jgi:hypothetical protein